MLHSLPELHFPDPVENEKDFFDRKAERELIDFRIGQGMVRPLVILGERRMGKTSLHRVSRPRLAELGFPCISPILTDYTLECLTSELLRGMCFKLRFPPDQTGMIDSHGEFHLTAIADYVNVLHKIFYTVDNRPLVVEMDEFDSVINSCEDLERRRLLDFILRLIETHDLPLKFFFTMTRPSEQMRHSYPTSFLSESDIVHLHPFERAETDEMIVTLLANQMVLAEETLTSLFRISGGHPYFLKLLLECLFQRYSQYSPTVVITPERLQGALGLAVNEPRAEHSVLNLIEVHMTPSERMVLSDLVRANGALPPDQIEARSPAWTAAAADLIRRDYIQQDAAGQYGFRIEYLYHFIKARPLLWTTRSAALRVEQDRVFRGEHEIALDERERQVFLFLYERRTAKMVLKNDIYDHIAPGQKGSADQRNAMVNEIVMRLRKKIEEDWRRPAHLIDAGFGFRLVDAE